MQKGKKMKDTEIFDMLLKNTGLSKNDVTDYRPCNRVYGIVPTIKDAIIINLKENGTLVYIPDKNPDGNQITRKKPDIKAKIIMQDGILVGTLVSPDAKTAGLELDIVDADSECDTEAAIRHELSKPGMEQIDIDVRHPEYP